MLPHHHEQVRLAAGLKVKRLAVPFKGEASLKDTQVTKDGAYIIYWFKSR